jgi:hypothetical protein
MTVDDEIKSVRVMGDLIESYLVADQARSMGLEADPKEIQDRILVDAFFDEETKEFNEELYQNYLRNLGATSDQYKLLITHEVLREKVIDVLAGMVTVSDTEVEQAYTDMHEQVRFEYVAVDPKSIGPLVPVTAAEIAEAQKDEAALKTWCDANAGECDAEAKASIRALKVNAATDAEKPAAQTKIDGFKTELAALTGEQLKTKFEELAKASSDDVVTKAKGGLYPSAMGQAQWESLFGAPASAAIMGLAKGTTSNVVDSAGGLWLFYAEDVQAGGDAWKATAATSVARQKKAPEHAKTVAKQILDAV